MAKKVKVTDALGVSHFQVLMTSQSDYVVLRGLGEYGTATVEIQTRIVMDNPAESSGYLTLPEDGTYIAPFAKIIYIGKGNEVAISVTAIDAATEMWIEATAG